MTASNDLIMELEELKNLIDPDGTRGTHLYRFDKRPNLANAPENDDGETGDRGND